MIIIAAIENHLSRKERDGTFQLLLQKRLTLEQAIIKKMLDGISVAGVYWHRLSSFGNNISLSDEEC